MESLSKLLTVESREVEDKATLASTGERSEWWRRKWPGGRWRVVGERGVVVGRCAAARNVGKVVNQPHTQLVQQAIFEFSG